MAKGIDQFRKNLKLLKEQQIRVGWLEGNVYPDGTPVAQVAFFNEYGGVRKTKDGEVVLPARAPVRITIDTKAKQLSEESAPIIAKGLQNDKVMQALNLVGLKAQSMLQDTIGSGLPPPNAEATVDGMLLKRKIPDGEGFKRKESGALEYEEYRAGSAQKENRTFGQGKGFNKPLIDTSQLMNSVTYVVEES